MTDVKLVKDCGLYPSYKKIIDFTGTKSEIIQKQLTWIDTFDNDVFLNVNYNKFQNKLTLPIDYTEALGYTYCVLTDITGTDGKPQFFFINDVANLTNGIEDAEPNVSLDLSLDPIMTFMGEWKLDECMINRSHADRWSYNSTKPIRITPNLDGVTAFLKTVKQQKLEGRLGSDIALCVMTFASPYIKFDLDYLGQSYWSEGTFEIEHRVFQACFLVNIFNPNIHIKTRVNAIYHASYSSDISNLTGEYSGINEFPSLSDVLTGNFQKNLPVVDNTIVSFTLTTAEYLNVTIEQVGGETVYTIGDIPTQELYFNQDGSTADCELTEISKFGWLPITNDVVNVNYRLDGTSWVIDTNISDYQVVVFKDLTDVENDKLTTAISSTVWMIPEKPTDGVTKDVVYEPAMFMQPFMSRKIVRGDGTVVFEIPDIDYTNPNLTLRTLIASSGISTMFIHGNELIANMANGEVAVDNSTVLDVTNDQWKEYVYTQRDTDRQMVSNYAWKNAIDNLIYMSYGGALVGSRSAGEEGYIAKGYGGYSQVKYYDGGGTGAYASDRGRTIYPHGQTPGSLTATGRRVIGAIGLAAGASIVTSLVDAHTMFANQEQKEKQIRNEPTSLLNIGEGIESVLVGYKDYYYVTQRVDDINFDKAFENFWKYGYWINKFEKPDTQSRKYFNYILTNGAIVNGAINQSIRDVIASIFDAGVTIFHYDSGDTKTRKLEYTDKENIEVSLI